MKMKTSLGKNPCPPQIFGLVSGTGSWEVVTKYNSSHRVRILSLTPIIFPSSFIAVTTIHEWLEKFCFPETKNADF